MACHNETTLLPNGVKCPAFALLVRNKTNSPVNDASSSMGVKVAGFDASSYNKECVLTIRGTISAMDWTINIKEDIEPFTYYLASPGKDHSSVQGFVHGGMYQGVLGILDSYGVRNIIASFAELGYNISVIGHSLGAGSSVLAAAELQNGFRLSSVAALRTAGVRAMAFATPPVTCATIADAINKDGLVLSVIDRFDAVPRLSRANMTQLAGDIQSFTDKSAEWRKQDFDSLKAYASTCGKAGDMTSLEEAISDVSRSLDVESRSTESTVEASAAVITKSSPVTAQGMIAVQPPGAAISILRAKVVQPGSQSTTVTASVIEKTPLVSPGIIIHIYRRNDVIFASLIDYRHPTLNRLTVIGEKVLPSHKMHSYNAALRSLNFQNKLLLTRDTATLNIHDRVLKEAANDGAEQVPGLLHSRQSLLAPPHVDVKYTSLNSDQWRRCQVCDLDTNWPFILKSNSNRAQTTHTCGACGKICCCLCAPAGDSIPGDGFNTSVTLPQWSICLPAKAILSPVRVCAHCFFDSYDL